MSVDDDGRGTDTRVDERGGVIRKPVMATADVRFVDPDTRPLLPHGLPRRGMSSVAALSALLVHENHRAEGSWLQSYCYGIPEDELMPLPPRGHSGTVVRFRAVVDGPERHTDAVLAAFSALQINVT